MNIIVLSGGLSMERDVSLKSGVMIAEALKRLGHKAVVVDSFFGCRGQLRDPKDVFDVEQNSAADDIKEEFPDLETLKKSRSQNNDSRIGDDLLDVCRAADIVFLALHGADGEDGRLQAAFDMAGVRYTGSGYMGSAIAMNKAAAKDMFRAYGIRTPEGRVINVNDSDKSFPKLPCVVKPKSSGSSVGTSIAHTEEEYEKALEFGFMYEEDVLVEQYIKGREIDVGVINGKALPPIEICPKSGFFDYKNKYQSGMTDEYCPADITPELTEQLKEAALRVFRALYLDVYARMDFIVQEGTGDIYCLEANTLPGMTPASLMPKEAAADGIAYDELCQMIIDLSLKKYA